MKKKKTDSQPGKNSTETLPDLKNETQKEKGIMKGYNEKNPSQPEGAFKPDAVSKKN